MIGETLSHFKITEKLGQGGMGVVYRGVDLSLDRPVAIKILPPEQQQKEESEARFLREARTASKLQHPAITTIYEFGVKDDLRYLVMEFIEGKTLKGMLQSGPLAIRQVLEIGIQIADALSLAGEKGIIHRDIKSENIMLTERGQVKILDFGLAKMMEKAGPVGPETFQTVGGVVMGTVSYMSPEQALGAELDARTDIYSTGVVFYEMATGKLPFAGSSPSVVLAKVLNQPPPSLTDLNPQVPPALEKIIFKCLEKNRDQRYSDAQSFLGDLRALKQETERARDWSGTVVMPSVADTRLTPEATDRLQELVPPSSSSVSATGGTAAATLSAPQVAGSTGAAEAVPRPKPVPKAASKAWRAPASFLVKSVRKVIATVALLYASACLVLFLLPFVRPERWSNSMWVRWLHTATDPVLSFATSVANFDLRYQDFDFMLLGVALVVYFLQIFLTGRLLWLEAQIQKPQLRAATAGAIPQISTSPAAARASRMSLLREYAAAKQMLSTVKKELAFLSIDVVGSTKMKIGEDKISIEHAFAEYKKFLERVFREHRAHKLAWTPDGVMSCFHSMDDAAAAARKLLTDLDWFNRDVHQLRAKFHVRCGLNCGEVLFPEDKPLEEISDEVIDVAGHLQKYAESDTLWVSEDVYNRLQDRSGFARMDTPVDNHTVFSWRKPPGKG